MSWRGFGAHSSSRTDNAEPDDTDSVLRVSDRFEISGELIYWRGPSPYYFVAVPADESRDIQAVAAEVSYGWGVIPVTVWIGDTEFSTSLFPKDGSYLVPIKAAVRTREKIVDGDVIALSFILGR